MKTERDRHGLGARLWVGALAPVPDGSIHITLCDNTTVCGEAGKPGRCDFHCHSACSVKLNRSGEHFTRCANKCLMEFATFTSPEGLCSSYNPDGICAHPISLL